jgi:hypothetical protein
MRSLAINGVALIGVSTYIVTGLEGFEDPERRVGSYVRSGEDGGNIGTNLYGLRSVSITGVITGAGDKSVYVAARKSLIAACRLKSDAYGVPELVQITVTDDDETDYFFDVVVKSFKAPPRTPSSAVFIIQAVAPDPLIYQATAQSSGQIARPVSGGAVYPLIYPVTYSDTSGGVATIYNDGESETWPVITLRGVMLNPYIYSVEADRFIELAYEVDTPEDVIVIDMKAKTIMLNGTTSLISTKSTDSDWFALALGPNTIRFSTGLTSDPGTMEVTANAGVLGVV